MHYPCSSLSLLRKTKAKPIVEKVSLTWYLMLTLIWTARLPEIILHTHCVCFSVTYLFISQLPLPRSPRTSLWLRPRDLSLSIFVDLLSIFDSSGHALLFETLSTPDCPPSSMTIPSQPLMSSFCYEVSVFSPLVHSLLCPVSQQHSG